jgi:hypothetical protein
MRQAGRVNDALDDLDTLVDAWLTVPEAGERLGEPANRARQLLRDGKLLGVRRGENNALYVPAAFLGDGVIVKGLPGVITVLRDNRYSDEEAVRWLYTPDDSLPGRPIDALRENRGTEVKRRAQALGF